MKYYIKSNGKTYGPVEENKIREKVLSCFFSHNSFVSLDFKEWLPLQQCIPILNTKNLQPNAGEEEIPMATLKTKKKKVFRLTEANLADQAAKGHKFITPETFAAILTVSIVLFLSLAGWGGYYLYTSLEESYSVKTQRPAKETWKEEKGGEKKGTNTAADVHSFQEVCNRYQPAVGLVVVTLETKEGKLLSKVLDYEVDPDNAIGTAFAIGKNKFVTNSHVAYAVKDQKGGVLDNVLLHYVIKAAIKDGVKTEEDFKNYWKKNEKVIEEIRQYLYENVRVRKVEIRLAHSDGKSMKVTGIQVHSKYQTEPKDSYKNAEFDIAIFTISGEVETFFHIASKKTLYELAQGQEIAYIGFPMEGLRDNGDLDINNPEAVFKSGTINKITDFNKVYSKPELNKSIVHDIPSAGGASGSPIFLDNGEIVAILWGGTVTGTNSLGERLSSAVQHNYATRIDSLDAVREEEIHDIKDWVGEGSK